MGHRRYVVQLRVPGALLVIISSIAFFIYDTRYAAMIYSDVDRAVNATEPGMDGLILHSSLSAAVLGFVTFPILAFAVYNVLWHRPMRPHQLSAIFIAGAVGYLGTFIAGAISVAAAIDPLPKQYFLFEERNYNTSSELKEYVDSYEHWLDVKYNRATVLGNKTAKADFVTAERQCRKEQEDYLIKHEVKFHAYQFLFSYVPLAEAYALEYSPAGAIPPRPRSLDQESFYYELPNQERTPVRRYLVSKIQEVPVCYGVEFEPENPEAPLDDDVCIREFQTVVACAPGWDTDRLRSVACRKRKKCVSEWQSESIEGRTNDLEEVGAVQRDIVYTGVDGVIRTYEGIWVYPEGWDNVQALKDFDRSLANVIEHVSLDSSFFYAFSLSFLTFGCVGWAIMLVGIVMKIILDIEDSKEEDIMP
jgi:hypothetical protein